MRIVRTDSDALFGSFYCDGNGARDIECDNDDHCQRTGGEATRESELKRNVYGQHASSPSLEKKTEQFEKQVT